MENVTMQWVVAEILDRNLSDALHREAIVESTDDDGILIHFPDGDDFFKIKIEGGA